MEDVGDNPGVLKGVRSGGLNGGYDSSGGDELNSVGSGGLNRRILFFIFAGVIVLAVGVFFLFGWIGNSLDVDDGGVGGGGDRRSSVLDNLGGSNRIYLRCDEFKESRVPLYVGCMVSVAISARREVCADSSVEWPEISFSGEIEGASTIDYCWKLMADDKKNVSYCDNILDISMKDVCEVSAGGAI